MTPVHVGDGARAGSASTAAGERLAVRLAIALAVALAVWGTYGERVAPAPIPGRSAAARPGTPAPPFILPSARGQPVDLNAFRGRPVVLNFWATWCPPCRVEMPAFERFAREGSAAAPVIGIDVGEDAATVDDFLRRYGITYPIALDGDGQVTRAYGVNGLPTTVFVDAAGVVRDRVVGPLTYDGLAQRAARLP